MGGGVGGWARWVMVTKEGSGCDDHCVLHVSNEPRTSTPETNSAPYVN